MIITEGPRSKARYIANPDFVELVNPDEAEEAGEVYHLVLTKSGVGVTDHAAGMSTDVLQRLRAYKTHNAARVALVFQTGIPGTEEQTYQQALRELGYACGESSEHFSNYDPTLLAEYLSVGNGTVSIRTDHLEVPQIAELIDKLVVMVDDYYKSQ